MRHTFPPKLIQKKSAELPPALLDAILSVDSANAIRDIGIKHHLPIDKLGILAEEVGWIMSGIAPTKEFIPALVDGLEISTAEASQIATEVNEKILLPIREFMKGFHGGEWEGQFKRVENRGQGLGDREKRIESREQTRGDREKSVENRVPMTTPIPTQSKPPAPPPPTQPNLEPLIIKPLPEIREQRIENREPFNPTQGKQEEKPTTQIPAKSPEIKLPQPQMEPKKEPTAPIVSPIIRGFSSEQKIENREQRTENREPFDSFDAAQSKQLPNNNQPAQGTSGQTLGTSSVPPPAYYQQAKEKAEQEIAAIQGTSGQALVTSGEQTKPPLPTGPSPYVISVNREQRIESREPFDAAQGKQQPTPSPIPTISVTPPSIENREQRVVSSEQSISNKQQVTSSIPQNPIRIEKKIPKPPAPESYSVDPYREITE